MTAGAIGSFAIWLGLAFALVALVTGKRWALAAAAVGLWCAVGVLVVALIGHDFSLEYVARTTSFATPWPYRLAALWGGMEGSLLFYAAMTLLFAGIALRKPGPVRVAAAAGLGLGVIVALLANPFVVGDIPAVDGEGLLAILQHPAMIYHPPILYAGLVVLVIPFALVVTGGSEAGERRVRDWLYVSWALLTVGMAAGANWAYVELGWGGFWAWDPVENTALMPWLAITAYLHMSLIEGRTGRLRRTTFFFACLPFALSVMGVYLTRSGATGSIHSFAEDALVGRVLLVAAAVVALVSLGAALRSRPGEPWSPTPLGRDWWLAANALLVTIILVFVTVGTAYPAVTGAFGDTPVLVDSDFFVTTVLPLAVLVALGLALGLGVDWRLVAAGSVAVLAVLWLGVGRGPGVPLLAAASTSLAVVAWRTVRRRPRGRLLVAHIAHAGMSLLLVGVAGSSLGDQASLSMTSGDSVVVAGHEVILHEVLVGEADRFRYVRAVVSVDGVEMTPEIRAYEDQRLPVAEPVLRSTPRADVTVAVSLLFPDGETVAISVFVRPLVWWVWVGSALMAVAGLLALFGRGGVFAARRRSATAELPAAGTTSDSAARSAPR